MSLVAWLRQLLDQIPRRHLVARHKLGDGTPVRVFDVYRHGELTRYLEVLGTYQSATYLDDRWCLPPFRYLRLAGRVLARPAGCARLLMLGGGGCAFARLVISTSPTATIDVVDVEPEMFAIAHQHFLLDRLIETYGDDRMGLIVDDALSHLAACADKGQRYDVIFNDCFDAAEPLWTLETPEAARLVHECLTKDGVYLQNVICALSDLAEGRLHNLVAVLSAEFAQIFVLVADDFDEDTADNVILVAADDDPLIPGEIRLVG